MRNRSARLGARRWINLRLLYDAVSSVRSRRVIAVGGAALAGWVVVARLLGAVSTLFADQGPAGRNKKDDKKGGDKKAKKGK